MTNQNRLNDLRVMMGTFNQDYSIKARFNTPLRSLDGLHLAVSSANQLNLLTADIRLADAARFFGLEVTLLLPG